MMTSPYPASPHTNAKAYCPTCKHVVDCRQLAYVQYNSTVRSTTLFHHVCNTEWTVDLNALLSNA